MKRNDLKFISDSKNAVLVNALLSRVTSDDSI